MSRFVIEERINDPAKLKQFDVQGYRFNAGQSKPDNLVFFARSRTGIRPVQPPTSTVGAGLPAIAVGQPTHMLLIHRYRRQASSHIFVCISALGSSFIWRQKIFRHIPNNFFTRHSSVFFVVAPLFFNGSGHKTILSHQLPITTGLNSKCYQYSTSAIFSNISKNFRKGDERPGTSS